jgi:hypothetical protein
VTPAAALRLQLVRLAFGCGVLAAMTATGSAQQAAPAAGDDAPAIRVGTMIFTDYTVTEQPRAVDVDGNEFMPNAFNVSRAYLNVTGTLSRLVAFRVTPDVVRETSQASSAAGSLMVRLKYAYAQFSLDQWLTRGSFVRFGMQQTPWIDFIDSVYRYRFQGTVFEDREGFLSSADIGATFRYALAGDYGDVHGGFYNGESFTRAEPNDQKAFMVRATFRPLPAPGPLRGLRVTGFYDHDAYVRNAIRRRAIAAVTYEHPNVNTGFNYLAATDQTRVVNPELDSRGFSFWVTPKTAKGWGWEGLVRYDHVRQEQATSPIEGERNRLITGIAYWFRRQGSVSAAVLLDYERVNHTRQVPARPDERRWGVKTLINF